MRNQSPHPVEPLQNEPNRESMTGNLDKLKGFTQGVYEKQKRIMAAVMIVVLGVVVLIVSKFMFGAIKRVDESEALAQKRPVKEITTGGRAMSAQELWMDKYEKRFDLVMRRLDAQDQFMKAALGGKGSYPPPESPPGEGVSYGKLRSDISDAKVNRVNPDVSHSPFREGGELPPSNSPSVSPSNPLGNFSTNTPSPPAKTPLQSVHSHSSSSQSPFQETGMKPSINKIVFSLDPSKSKMIKKSVDHYVPVGTFVRGMLTSGVVASTGVNATANPQPVHIQLTDLGNLPRQFKTDLKKCFLIGSAYGDLASERVFMRLEKFSCVERKTGEILETTVDGYVAGEDGSNGIRGIVVHRAAPALRSAFITGFLGGMGNFFASQQMNQPMTVTSSGFAAMKKPSAPDVLQGSAGKGVGNAMEKLSDYYIKLGEQMMPVIEVEGGRMVDVVFKDGFDLSQTVYRKALTEKRDQQRRDMVTTMSTNAATMTMPGE